MTQSVDNVALLPAYLAAGTAVLVLLADLFVGPPEGTGRDQIVRRGATVAVAAAGAAATAATAVLVGRAGPRRTFCVGDACSYVATGRSALVAALFALLTVGVLALSAPILRSGRVPAGEYCFLLACSMTGGVVLGAAGDLITLIVAVETLTLPLYILVGLRREREVRGAAEHHSRERTARTRGAVASAEAAVTFFVVSVVATAVTLLGAGLLYAVTGTVHLSQLGSAFARDAKLLDVPLTSAAVALVVLGLAFKVAAVPFHAWAPATYDGAPVPVAAYLSTASKLGGVVALLAVTAIALPAAVTGPVFAVLAVLTMTVGNLVALRQVRMVRLLAWSSVAQAGYIIAPLGALALAAGRTDAAMSDVVAATIAYAVFYVIMEFAAFGAVVALRPAGGGGWIDEYRGAARRHPWIGGAFVLALVGLAGLPPGLAGLFAKVTVVRALVGGGAVWLAVVVALNAVVGLAYYVRVAAVLYASDAGTYPTSGGVLPPPGRLPWAVSAALAAATFVALVVGFAPQLVLDAARF